MRAVATSWKDNLADLEKGYELLPAGCTREELFGPEATLTLSDAVRMYSANCAFTAAQAAQKSSAGRSN